MNLSQRNKKNQQKQKSKQRKQTLKLNSILINESNDNKNDIHSHSKKKSRTQHNVKLTSHSSTYHKKGLTSFEERIPDQVLESILNFLPDKYNFHPNYRSKNSSYGFENEDCFCQSPLELTPTCNPLSHDLQPDESEGNHWSTPSTSIRLVNKRWARIGAEVFLKHLSINSITRLKSLVKLFNSGNPYLPRVVRTLVIFFKFNHSDRLLHRSIRNNFSQLFNRLTALRSLSIRACPLGLLFPAPMEIKNLFLPSSIIRLAIEFQSDHHSALLSSLNNSLPDQNPYPENPIQLHAAELNLLLVCLPNLRSLHLSKFQSDPQRPISLYLSHPHSQNSPPIEPASFSSIQSLILTHCQLSMLDAQFISSKFRNLISLFVFNQTIDSNQIPIINHLLSTKLEPHHQLEHETKLAHNLESLTLKFIDFDFDYIRLINTFSDPTASNSSSSSNLKSIPRSSSVVATSLSNLHDPIDLSHLEKLKSLSVLTPTRVKFHNDNNQQFHPSSPYSSKMNQNDPDLGLFQNLTYLELDSKLLFHSNHHQVHFLSILNNFASPQFIRLGPLNSEGNQIENDHQVFIKLKQIKVIGYYMMQH